VISRRLQAADSLLYDSRSMEAALLSVVIPVYQGERFLEELSDRIAELRADLESRHSPVALAEAIFVDDGSIDDSRSVLEALARKHDWIRVVTLSRNFGQHPATIAGILHSSGDWVATLDEDLQHRPADLVPLLKCAIRNHFDLVYARPLGEVHRSRVRDLGSRGFKALVGRLTGNPHVPLFNSFRMMRGSIARAAAAVCANDPYFDIAICWFTSRIGSVPLELTDRRFIESRNSGYPLRALVRHAARMLLASEMKFLRLGAMIGIFALAGSVGLSAVVVGMKIWNPEAIHARGWVSLVLLISFFGGLTALLGGVLVELTSGLAARAKGKPEYFVVDRSGDALLRAWADAPEP
jgi:glycosyltransferase involved in cell wall biosynthesis